MIPPVVAAIIGTLASCAAFMAVWWMRLVSADLREIRESQGLLLQLVARIDERTLDHGRRIRVLEGDLARPGAAGDA